MRFEVEVTVYGDAPVLKRFQANETSISVLQGKISAIISESELVELANGNITMYSKLASAEMDIDSLTLNFSDLTTKYEAVSEQYTSLDSKVAEYKLGVDGLEADISSVQQNLSQNYSTTTAMNAAITAKANEISAELSAVQTNLQNNYSTTTQMNAAINAKANEISLSVSSQIAAINGDITQMSAAITTNAENIALKVEKGGVISEINQSSEKIFLSANRLVINSTNFKLTEDGNVTITGGSISFTNEEGESYMNIENGLLETRTRSNDYKGIIIHDNRVDFYSWSEEDNYVGAISSYKDSNGKIGISISCDYRDGIVFGYKESQDDTRYKNSIEINKENDGKIDFYKETFWTSGTNRAGSIRTYKRSSDETLGIGLFGDYLDNVAVGYKDSSGNDHFALEVDSRDNNKVKFYTPVSIPYKSNNVINGMHFFAGTNVVTLQDSGFGLAYAAFSGSGVRSNLGLATANGDNTICFACNGDDNANEWSVNGVTYDRNNDRWIVYINGGSPGNPARVNFMAFSWATS